MAPHSGLQQAIINKCQRCFLVPRLFCAVSPCCNLNMCPECFFHNDHPCGPGTNNVPVGRCLDRCDLRLDNGWGDRCWHACRRALGHQGYCDCLGDHKGWRAPIRIPPRPMLSHGLTSTTCTCNADQDYPPLFCYKHSAEQARIHSSCLVWVPRTESVVVTEPEMTSSSTEEH